MLTYDLGPGNGGGYVLEAHSGGARRGGAAEPAALTHLWQRAVLSDPGAEGGEPQHETGGWEWRKQRSQYRWGQVNDACQLISHLADPRFSSGMASHDVASVTSGVDDASRHSPPSDPRFSSLMTSHIMPATSLANESNGIV